MAVRFLGGFESAGYIHRICAIITFFYFGAHIFDLIRTKFQKRHLQTDLFGPDSMLPKRQDLKEFIGSLKWFIGIGPRPAYGRWTYWEKFDYFAVFWGVAVIGTTGLMLWFPEFFTHSCRGGYQCRDHHPFRRGALATGFILPSTSSTPTSARRNSPWIR